MAISNFSGDEDKDEINPMEWLSMIKKKYLSACWATFSFWGEASRWWNSLDEDIRRNTTWEKFEELFSNKWIRDTKMDAMYRTQDELKEAKEDFKKKSGGLFKI
jgi:hypothetical protein